MKVSNLADWRADSQLECRWVSNWHRSPHSHSRTLMKSIYISQQALYQKEMSNVDIVWIARGSSSDVGSLGFGFSLCDITRSAVKNEMLNDQGCNSTRTSLLVTKLFGHRFYARSFCFHQFSGRLAGLQSSFYQIDYCSSHENARRSVVLYVVLSLICSMHLHHDLWPQMFWLYGQVLFKSGARLSSWNFAK